MSRDVSCAFCCKGKQKNEVKSRRRYEVRENFDFVLFLRGNVGCLKVNDYVCVKRERRSAGVTSLSS